MTQQDMIVLAKSIADKHQLFGHIVCGICEQESTWNPYEIRFEPAWYNRTDWPVLLPQHKYPRLSSEKSEITSRSMSWGLMQCLGQSIREIGFEDWLTDLCDPAIGIEWGCRLFDLKLKHTGGNIEQALLIWNGGADKTYPSQVLTKSEVYK